MKKTVLLARRIALALLFLQAAGPAAAGWQAVAAQLQALGWQVVEEPDGSLRVHPPVAADIGNDTVNDVITIRGWHIAREADGTLLLRPAPPTPPAEAAEAAEAAGAAPEQVPQSSAGLLAPADEERLESLGWQVEHAEDGSVLLFPPAPTVEAESARPELPPVPAIQPVAPRIPRIMDEATVSRLRAHGWHVEYAADGSILLYPPEQQAAVAPPAEVAADKQTPAEETADFSDDAVLDILEKRGWTVERAPDDSLLLYPRGHAAPSADESVAESLPGTCEGYETAALTAGEIKSPLLTPEDVVVVARSWLRDAQADDLAVGRIRQVFRVYIVSIVDASPPHRLRHQLAIRRDDARVILLD